MNINDKFFDGIRKEIFDAMKKYQKTITLRREDVEDDFFFERDYPCCGACVLANSDIQKIAQEIAKIIYLKMLNERKFDR